MNIAYVCSYNCLFIFALHLDTFLFHPQPEVTPPNVSKKNWVLLNVQFLLSCSKPPSTLTTCRRKFTPVLYWAHDECWFHRHSVCVTESWISQIEMARELRTKIEHVPYVVFIKSLHRNTTTTTTTTTKISKKSLIILLISALCLQRKLIGWLYRQHHP
jgi:hypothetical protein